MHRLPLRLNGKYLRIHQELIVFSYTTYDVRTLTFGKIISQNIINRIWFAPDISCREGNSFC
jgi:hypothetical protein